MQQIIDKPKQHKLPFSLSRKIVLKHHHSHLPNIDFSGLKIRKKMHNSPNKRIQYQFNIDKNHFRPTIRTVLSKQITFEKLPNKQQYSPQSFLSKIKEPVKTLSYSNIRLKLLIENVRDIFGEDYPIKDRDVIVVEGNITKKYYLFFTSVQLRPFSLCCRVPIYLKLADFEDNDFLKNQVTNEMSGIINKRTQPSKILRTYFICSKCQKSVLRLIAMKKVQAIKHSGRQKWDKAKSRQESQMEIQRKKISLSVMIASGKFKKIRLNEDRSGSKNKRYEKQQADGNNISMSYNTGNTLNILRTHNNK